MKTPGWHKKGERDMEGTLENEYFFAPGHVFV